MKSLQSTEINLQSVGIDLPLLAQGFKSYGCYATYFFFSDELLTYMGAQSGPPTVSGYEGKVWALRVSICELL